MSNSTIFTERLSLNPFMEQYSSFILELLNTKGWLTFIGNRNVNNEEEALAYIRKINSNENVTYWTVTIMESRDMIGIITFIKRDYLDYHDIGFAFLPQFHGRGYAFEAADAILNHLKANRNIDTILATTIPQNVSSIKLLENLGLSFDKSIVVNEETLHVYKAGLTST